MTLRNHLVCVLAALVSLCTPPAPTFGQDRDPGKAVLIFLDDLHIDFSHTPALRAGLRQAIERLVGAGCAVAIVSDGPSSVAVRPTGENAPLLQVANRITGAGLRPSDIADPTPAMTADIRRRESVTQATFQDCCDRNPI